MSEARMMGRPPVLPVLEGMAGSPAPERTSAAAAASAGVAARLAAARANPVLAPPPEAVREPSFAIGPDTGRVRTMFSDKRLLVLAGLVLCTFLLGGGSRGDIASLVILRPLAFACLALALLWGPSEQRRGLTLPLGLVLALAGLMAMQLIPLPPQWWSALPGRAQVAAVDDLAGLGEIWRPLTLSPSRTLDALLSLGVPLAGFALLATQLRERPVLLVWMLVAAGGVTALLGIAQVMGAPDGPLYFYRITNEGLAVGLFANRNHHAIFLASLIPLVGWLAIDATYRRQRDLRMLGLIGGASGILLVLVVTLLAGSRAGLVLALCNCMALSALWWRQRGGAKAIAGKMRKAPVWMISAGVLGGLLAMVSALDAGSRSLAMERLFATNLDAEFRFASLPYVWELAHTYFPAGSGFGTFYLVYQGVEPVELLRPQYLNQAHNDLLQIVIEGGLAGAILLAIGLLWFARAGWQAWLGLRLRKASAGKQAPDIAPFAWLALATLLAGSVFDYPLRTPSIALTAAILAWLLVRRPGPSARSSNSGDLS